ncbi:MAG TPA: nuclear transport factor 2 family protein [Steroidobacteraceae bacterium]|jgi:ketosteroid isomerase-like protein
MKETAMSRRRVLGAGGCALAAAAIIPGIAGARAETGLSSKKEELVRRYYRGWEAKDWHPVDLLLADDFTFTSPVDDHISKSAFKAGCWDTQVAFIQRFDLKQVIGTGDDAFVMYVCHTTNGKTFRNVEYLRFRGEQLRAVECYFGGQNTFPSAVSRQK